MSVDLRFRPIVSWPGAETVEPRWSPFKADWPTTMILLERELSHLGAQSATIEVWARDRDIRADGQLRIDVKLEKPGVILSFDSMHGPLRYPCDRFDGTEWGRQPGWRANVRAIALGLEALRKVERYGIASRAEQYTGWKALGAGIAIGQSAQVRFGSLEEAALFLIKHGENPNMTEGPAADPAELIAGPVAEEVRSLYYRRASLKLHPDAGGDAEDFARLGEARRMLDQADR